MQSTSIIGAMPFVHDEDDIVVVVGSSPRTVVMPPNSTVTTSIHTNHKEDLIEETTITSSSDDHIPTVVEAATATDRSRGHYGNLHQLLGSYGNIHNETANFEVAGQYDEPNSFHVSVNVGDTSQGLNRPSNSINNADVEQGGGAQLSSTSKVGRCCHSTFHNTLRMYQWVVLGIAVVTAITGVSLGTLSTELFKTKNQKVKEVCEYFGIPDVDLCKMETSMEFPQGILYFSSSTIPTGIGLLSQLTSLTAGESAGLTGPIPSTIGKLVNLKYLDLSKNGLTGSIPTTIESLTGLTYLDVSDNQLRGTIPSSIGATITLLTHLNFGTNDFGGTIPILLTNLVQLRYLDFYRNKLTGNIPSEMGNLLLLQHLDFDENQLTGTIPSELGNLSRLTSLYLDTNEFEGSIPSTFKNLMDLTILQLHNNALTGTIPSTLCSKADEIEISIDCAEISCMCCNDGDGGIYYTSDCPTPSPSST